MIFHEGPIKIVASCSENTAQIVLTLLNTEKDMLVFGQTSSHEILSGSPIGDTSEGVLNAGVTFDEVMWEAWGRFDNNIAVGAVTLKTLTSAETYYIGWDGESFVGIATADGLIGGGNCALAGVFYHFFCALDVPPVGSSTSLYNQLRGVESSCQVS